MTIQAAPAGQTSASSTGKIYVASTPAGASAILDGGSDQLFTPGTFAGVLPGTHVVEISRQGFSPRRETVRVSAGTTKNVIVTLDPLTDPGGLFVRSLPQGASLFVDDFYMGKTDQVVGNLAPGPHTVRISEAGYGVWEKTVTVTGGEIMPVRATLVPEEGPTTADLTVASTPTGAAVFLDGDFRGTTPPDYLLVIENLRPGSYTVAVKKPGYADYTTAVTLQPGEKGEVFAPLVSKGRSLASVSISSTPSGADVFINSAYVGRTPLTFHDVPAGNYTVDITMEGYSPFSSSGQMMGGQDVSVFAALSSRQGPVPVQSPTREAPLGVFSLVSSIIIAGIALSCWKRE